MKQLIATVLFLLGSQVALGHGDHTPAPKATCKGTCTLLELKPVLPEALDFLASNGVITNSELWKTAKVDGKLSEKTVRGEKLLVALLTQKDEKKLNVFFATNGELRGAKPAGE